VFITLQVLNEEYHSFPPGYLHLTAAKAKYALIDEKYVPACVPDQREAFDDSCMGRIVETLNKWVTCSVCLICVQTSAGTRRRRYHVRVAWQPRAVHDRGDDRPNHTSSAHAYFVQTGKMALKKCSTRIWRWPVGWKWVSQWADSA
jgi:hypothetical protein